MKFKGEKTQKEFKTPISSILMYVGSLLVALVGIASLINNVLLFNSSITDYLAQGYKKADVVKHLIPGQLLPAIFEAAAFYGGIAIILLSAGIINNKISKSLVLLSITKNAVNIENEKTNETEVEETVVYDEIKELISSTHNN